MTRVVRLRDVGVERREDRERERDRAVRCLRVKRQVRERLGLEARQERQRARGVGVAAVAVLPHIGIGEFHPRERRDRVFVREELRRLDGDARGQGEVVVEERHVRSRGRDVRAVPREVRRRAALDEARRHGRHARHAQRRRVPREALRVERRVDAVLGFELRDGGRELRHRDRSNAAASASRGSSRSYGERSRVAGRTRDESRFLRPRRKPLRCLVNCSSEDARRLVVVFRSG
mmetsp:Transcript_31568/g.97467  ORF Transcript_31568/g.97467 Transcript_31568/m.97467 type:complete len:234 (+) Transcript_31568:202-903(+)